uniref:Outer membrane protein beta-barrel domain-containing protein n=2 Tax=Paracidobacterium acidisoli TaxID=2303751 RepID=A0A372IRG9_9BACT
MRYLLFPGVCLFALTLAAQPVRPAARAQTIRPLITLPAGGAAFTPVSTSTSSASLPVARPEPAYETAYSSSLLPEPETLVRTASPDRPLTAMRAATVLPSQHIAPFSGFALGVRMGTLGIGFEGATPLAQHFNLRAGANFFSFSDNFTTSGFTYQATLHLRSADASVDWYPWAKGFHISPGVLLYNGNDAAASFQAPAGTVFTLNDVDYLSSATDPVTGGASLKFNRAAPKLTVGFGNHIPRSGRHFSVPFEIGFAYVGDANLVLNLHGTACDAQGRGCENVADDPGVQANLKAQQQKYQSDANDARFYPVMSVGFAYSF